MMHGQANIKLVRVYVFQSNTRSYPNYSNNIL